jgi:hypothetical protein
MDLLNFKVSWDLKTQFNNVDFLPKSIRGLLIGSSDSGKTTLLFKLLLGTNILDYNNLFIFSKSLNQKEYELLIEGFKHHLTKEMIRGMFENQNEFKDTRISDICHGIETGLSHKEKGDIKVSAFGNNANVPDPSLLDSKKKNLMIFDDVLLEKQRIIESYYTKGRHNSCQSFYISQSFFGIPKGTVRDNSNLLILFKLNDMDVTHIHRQIAATDMSLDTFRNVCKNVWTEKYKFLVINKDHDNNLNLKYTDGFTKQLNDILPGWSSRH